MKNYKLQVTENKDMSKKFEIPFICVTDSGKYSLIYESQNGNYSAIDLETGKQINCQHPNLNRLFEDYPATLGKPVESEVLVLK
jgi:hypothetical protein